MPYELGRAKARQIKSLQAAGWFENGQDEKTCGDFVQFAVMARNEARVVQWLAQAPGAAAPSSPVDPSCQAHNTTELK